MRGIINRVLYRVLPLRGYLRCVSSLLFLWQRLGLGRNTEALEYLYHLPNLVTKGDITIDIGANLGYYSRTLSRSVGSQGVVYAVEPVPIVLDVLRHNLNKCQNVVILPYALGSEAKTISMGNNSARSTGYMGTGQNFVNESNEGCDVEFSAQMRRPDELFSGLERLDFIKCDIEGYEVVVLSEMRELLERFHPTVLVETGGKNRQEIIKLFSSMGYRGTTLHNGEEVALSDKNEKDIIFRWQCE